MTYGVVLGDVTMWDRNWMPRLRAHVGNEGYVQTPGKEIIELTKRQETRSSALAKPYLMQPEVHVLLQSTVPMLASASARW